MGKSAYRRQVFAALIAGALQPLIGAAQDAGSGPFPAVMLMDPGLPTHTVYRPSDLGTFGGARALPVVAWGNGGCANAGDSQRRFLAEIASHGMLVIAIGPIRGDAPPPARPRDGGDGPPRSAPPTRAEQLTEAIDWAIAENGRPGSAYFGRIDAAAVAVMGYSCGGLQALSQALDPRVRTLALWNSGVLPATDRRPGMGADKDLLEQLAIPVAYIAGGPSDIAYPNAVDDVARIRGVPLFFGNLDVGHGGTYSQPNGGAYGRVASDWLRWQLLGDEDAARTFVGDDCGLCGDPEWTVEKWLID